MSNERINFYYEFKRTRPEAMYIRGTRTRKTDKTFAKGLLIERKPKSTADATLVSSFLTSYIKIIIKYYHSYVTLFSIYLDNNLAVR